MRLTPKQANIRWRALVNLGDIGAAAERLGISRGLMHEWAKNNWPARPSWVPDELEPGSHERTKQRRDARIREALLATGNKVVPAAKLLGLTHQAVSVWRRTRGQDLLPPRAQRETPRRERLSAAELEVHDRTYKRWYKREQRRGGSVEERRAVAKLAAVRAVESYRRTGVEDRGVQPSLVPVSPALYGHLRAAARRADVSVLEWMDAAVRLALASARRR